MAEGQVLQLTVGLVQAQAVGNRGVDLQGFRGNASPFAARHVRQRSHVVRAVGQFDEDDTHIARHGQEHLAEGFGLVFLACVEFQLVELGEAIDQFRHGCTKALDQIHLGDATVFHGVVQQGGHQGLGIEFPGGTLRSHGDGMGDVRLAVLAQLAQVGLVSEAVGLAHLLDAGVVQVVQAVRERSKAGRCGIRCGPGRGAGWHGIDRGTGLHFHSFNVARLLATLRANASMALIHKKKHRIAVLGRCQGEISPALF